MEYQKEAAYLLALVFPMFTGGLPWLHGAGRNSLLYDSVEVKILEETDEPGPSYVSHVGQRIKRSTDAMPNSLHFRIRYGSREQNIRMRRNAFGLNKEGKSDVPDFPVFIIENGRIKRKELQHDKGIALYSNESTGSSFMVRKRSNRADFILNGVFYDGLDQLSLTSDARGGLHQIHKQNGVVDFRNDYINTGDSEDAKEKRQETANLLLRKPHVRSKRQLTHAGENEVQLFMIADNKDYRTWLEYYRQNSTLTQIEMNLYYAFVANSMNVRYSSIKNVDSSFSLKIIISGLLIVNSQKVSTWTEDNFDPLTRYVDATRALEAFRLWIKSSRYDLPPSDHWMLFTGFDISTDGNRNVAGLAKLGGMCSLNSVSLIEQDNTGSVGATAAHELGHSLSALHDGEEKDCIDEDNYIMSRKLMTPDKELLASRPWQFSPCSVRAFKKFISESKCTQKSVRGMSVLSTSLSPGQVFSADLQCQLAMGNGSYFGRSLQLEEGYPSLCRRMWCSDPVTPGYFQGIFALEHTSCGDGKWCQQGQCVQDTLAPRMEDICPQGDDPTAPCAVDDCLYYTNRTKLVYCCKRCRQEPPWPDVVPLVQEVVRQIEVSPVMTLNPQGSHGAIDVFDESTLAPDRTRPEAHHQTSSSTEGHHQTSSSTEGHHQTSSSTEAHHQTSSSTEAPHREQSTAPREHISQGPPLNDRSSKPTDIPQMSQGATGMPTTVESGLGSDPITTDIPAMSLRATTMSAIAEPGMVDSSITTDIPDMSQRATTMSAIAEPGLVVDPITTDIPDMSQRATTMSAIAEPGLVVDPITTDIPDISQRATTMSAIAKPGLGSDNKTTDIPGMSQAAPKMSAIAEPGLGSDNKTTDIPGMSQAAPKMSAIPELGSDNKTTDIPGMSQAAPKMSAIAEPGLVDDSIATGIPLVFLSTTKMPPTVESQLGVDSAGRDNHASLSPDIAASSSFVAQQTTESFQWASVENTKAVNDVSTITSSPRTGSTTETSTSDVPALSTTYISTTVIPDTPQMMTTTDIVTIKDDERLATHNPHEVPGRQAYADLMPGSGSYRATTIAAATAAGPVTQRSSPDESLQSPPRARPRHALYNLSGLITSHITLPSLLSLLIPDMNATWQLREDGQLSGQATGGMLASRQSQVSSQTVVSIVPKSRHSFEDSRPGGNARDTVYHVGRRQHLPDIIHRISVMNRNKTSQPLNSGNSTHPSHQTLLSSSSSLVRSVHIAASTPGGLLNTSTDNTPTHNNSVLASDNSSLRSSNAGFTQSSQDNNLAHKDYLKQILAHFHLKTNKIDQNAVLPSVAGQSLVISDELGSQGQVATDSLQGLGLLKTLLLPRDHISRDNRSATELNKSRYLIVNTSMPVHKLPTHENKSLTLVHTSQEDGRLYGQNRTQAGSIAETLRADDLFTRRITTASPFTAIINNLMSQTTQMSHTVSLSPLSQTMTPQNHLQHSQANSLLVTNYRVPDRAAQDRPTVNHLDLSLPVMVYTHKVPAVRTAPIPIVDSLFPDTHNVPAVRTAPIPIVDSLFPDTHNVPAVRTAPIPIVDSLFPDTQNVPAVRTAPIPIVDSLFPDTHNVPAVRTAPIPIVDSLFPDTHNVPAVRTAPIPIVDSLFPDTHNVPAVRTAPIPIVDSLFPDTHNVPAVRTAPIPIVDSLFPHISNRVQDFDQVQTGHVDNDISQNVNRIPTLPRYQDALSSNTAIDPPPVSTEGQRTAHLTNMDNAIPKEGIVSAPITDQVANGLDHNVHVLNLASSGTFWNGVSNNGRIQDGSQYLNKPTL